MKQRHMSIRRLALRVTVAIAALAAAGMAIVTALFVDTLRRYGL